MEGGARALANGVRLHVCVVLISGVFRRAFQLLYAGMLQQHWLFVSVFPPTR